MSSWQNRNTSYQQNQSASNSNSANRSSGNRSSNIDGQMFDIIGDRAATLAWEESTGGNPQIIQGGSNYSILSDFKGSIVRLWDDFFSGNNAIQLESGKK